MSDMLFCYCCRTHHPKEQMRRFTTRTGQRWRCLRSIEAAIEYYLPLFFDEMASIFDYLPRDALFVRHGEGGTTFCPNCHAALIVRDWYDIGRYDLDPQGHCPHCQTAIAGRFGPILGHDGRAFGPRRIPVRLWL